VVSFAATAIYPNPRPDCQPGIAVPPFWTYNMRAFDVKEQR
jgi:hypothetical protein